MREAAANLFAMLRELDKSAHAHRRLPIPETGLGEAINDRLRRAAALAGADMGEIFDRLKEAAGPNGFSEDAGEIAPHLEEWRSRIAGQEPAAAEARHHRAGLRDPCHLPRDRHALVTQGGNTGLVGGQIPLAWRSAAVASSA